VREAIDSRAQESFRILEVEDVGGDLFPALVRFVDDGAEELGSEFLVLFVPIVDPNLDDVDGAGDLVVDRLSGFLSVVTQ
jgi:hypothetical protein